MAGKSRSESVDTLFWYGLSDHASDILGSVAAGAVMRLAAETDNPAIVLMAIDNHMEHELENLLTSQTA